jgi:hypothetical protein
MPKELHGHIRGEKAGFWADVYGIEDVDEHQSILEGCTFGCIYPM